MRTPFARFRLASECHLGDAPKLGQNPETHAAFCGLEPAVGGVSKRSTRAASGSALAPSRARRCLKAAATKRQTAWVASSSRSCQLAVLSHHAVLALTMRRERPGARQRARQRLLARCWRASKHLSPRAGVSEPLPTAIALSWLCTLPLRGTPTPRDQGKISRPTATRLPRWVSTRPQRWPTVRLLPQASPASVRRPIPSRRCGCQSR